jgi:hypothetical protein
VTVAEALAAATDLRKQIKELSGKASAKSADELAALTKDLVAVAGPALDPEEAYDLAGAAPTSLPASSRSSSPAFQAAVESADAAPTPDAVAGFAWRRERVAGGSGAVARVPRVTAPEGQPRPRGRGSGAAARGRSRPLTVDWRSGACFLDVFFAPGGPPGPAQVHDSQ